MKPVTNIHDMVSFTKNMCASYAEMKNLYSEYQAEVSVKGYDYGKDKYCKEKFPKFPLTLRKHIAERI